MVMRDWRQWMSLAQGRELVILSAAKSPIASIRDEILRCAQNDNEGRNLLRNLRLPKLPFVIGNIDCRARLLGQVLVELHFNLQHWSGVWDTIAPNAAPVLDFIATTKSSAQECRRV
jgi:hypothetical protein